jgi:hypothetical protein
MANLFAISDFYHLAFPGFLLVFYVVCWLAVGRDPKIPNVGPRYEPPAGISSGVARYILTGGSDGTTLAAVLAGLAAKGVVAIQPQGASYAVSLLNSSPILMPDEASAVRSLFNVVSTVQPYADSNTAILGEPSLPTSSQQTSGSQTSNISRNPVAASMRGTSVVSSDSGAAVGLSPSPESQVIIDPLAGPTIKGHMMRCRKPTGRTFRESTSARTFVMPALARLPHSCGPCSPQQRWKLSLQCLLASGCSCSRQLPAW